MASAPTAGVLVVCCGFREDKWVWVKKATPLGAAVSVHFYSYRRFFLGANASFLALVERL